MSGFFDDFVGNIEIIAQKTKFAKRKLLKDGRSYIQNKLSPSENITMIGLPNAGKTVYFCVCMDMIQRIFNHISQTDTVIFNSANTDQMITGVLNNLRDKGAQGWPPNTQDKEIHKVDITYNEIMKELTFQDYSGEAFISTFQQPIDLDTVYQGVSLISETTKTLLEDLINANGIILIIDATMLMDKPDPLLCKCLFNILYDIDMSGFSGKLAIVITKGDLIRNVNKDDIMEMFMDKHPNSFARLRKMKCEYKLFLVSAVQCEINENGEYVPPKNYTPGKNSKDVCAPMYWMLDIQRADYTLND